MLLILMAALGLFLDAQWLVRDAIFERSQQVLRGRGRAAVVEAPSGRAGAHVGIDAAHGGGHAAAGVWRPACASAPRALPDITPIAEQGALAVVVVGIVALLAALFWLVGGRVAMQFAELRTALPQALATTRNWLHTTPFGWALLDLIQSAKDAGVPWARVAVFTIGAIGGIVNAVLMVALGLYPAVSANMYYQGLLRLVPANAHPRVSVVALSSAGQGLH